MSFKHNSDAAAVVLVNLDIKKAALKSLELLSAEILVGPDLSGIRRLVFNTVKPYESNESLQHQKTLNITAKT